MKKRLLILAACFVAAAVMCLSVSIPAGLAHRATGNTPTQGADYTSTTKNNTLGDSAVRLYICEKEDAAACQALAERYTALTGCTVEILTGDLTALMKSTTPPTLFCIHSQEELVRWQNHCYDLSQTPLMEMLCSDDFALYHQGTPLALAMDVSAYGVIYNAHLLSMTGYTREDFSDGDSFRQKVEATTAEGADLGFAAFGYPDLTDPEQVAMLLGGCQTAEELRNLMDLLAANSISEDQDLLLFQTEEVVFYLGGSWEYEEISQVGFHKLDILPYFHTDGGVLPCICDTYWAINGLSPRQDVELTVEFLTWAATADADGTAPVDSLGMVTPFRDATGGDLFSRRLIRKYIATEPVVLYWDLYDGRTEEQLLAIGRALQTYAAAPSGDTWAPVEQLLQ